MPVSGDWTYTESAGNATITDYSGHATPTIPASLDGYPVVEIAANAMSNKSLTKLTIEHSVLLRNNCFYGNSGIDVILDSDVTTSVSPGYEPFENCSIGTGLTITSNVTTIPNYLFRNSGINGTLTIPSSVTSIDNSAFSTNSISSVTLDHVMNLNSNCFYGNSGIDVILDADVTTSGTSYLTGPFENCNVGIGLTITSNVTTIPSNLFADAELSGDLILPGSVSVINETAFYANPSLNNIYWYRNIFSSTFNTNAFGSTGSGDICYGYEYSAGELLGIALEEVGTYTFQSLDQTINLQSASLTFAESSATPNYTLSAAVTLSAGILELTGNDVTIQIPANVDLEAGSIIFSGNEITVDSGESPVATSSGGDGLELFIYVDLL